MASDQGCTSYEDDGEAFLGFVHRLGTTDIIVDGGKRHGAMEDRFRDNRLGKALTVSNEGGADGRAPST